MNNNSAFFWVAEKPSWPVALWTGCAFAFVLIWLAVSIAAPGISALCDRDGQ